RAELHYRGEAARRSTKLITAAFTAGLLEQHLAQEVNIVNAELIARERGIDIVEQISPRKGDFSTLIRADVVTDKKTYTAAGTPFAEREAMPTPIRRAALLSLLLLIPATAAQAPDKSAKPHAPFSAPTFGGLKLRALGPAVTSGRVIALAVDPKDPSHYYVAAA